VIHTIASRQLNPFSDDEHFVIFKDSAKKRLSEEGG
jgi:hypothetical protein